ncbi:MAG: hypothetical protein M3Z63_05575, partial [Gilliamella apicola]|nr:hypothetical protein [Gilliamella apicola]
MISNFGLTEWVAIILGIVSLILLILLVKSQLVINNSNQLFNLQLSQIRQENQTLTNELNQLESELNQYRQQNIAQFATISELKTRLEETRNAAHERQTILEQSEQRLTTQFENLANRI